MSRSLTVSHNVPRFQHTNKNVFSIRLNRWKLMSAWSGCSTASDLQLQNTCLHSCCRFVCVFNVCISCQLYSALVVTHQATFYHVRALSW